MNFLLSCNPSNTLPAEFQPRLMTHKPANVPCRYYLRWNYAESTLFAFKTRANKVQDRADNELQNHLQQDWATKLNNINICTLYWMHFFKLGNVNKKISKRDTFEIKLISFESLGTNLLSLRNNVTKCMEKKCTSPTWLWLLCKCFFLCWVILSFHF